MCKENCAKCAEEQNKKHEEIGTVADYILFEVLKFGQLVATSFACNFLSLRASVKWWQRSVRELPKSSELKRKSSNKTKKCVNEFLFK